MEGYEFVKMFPSHVTQSFYEAGSRYIAISETSVLFFTKFKLVKIKLMSVIINWCMKGFD